MVEKHSRLVEPAINDLHTYSMDRQQWKETIDAVAHGVPMTAAATGQRDRDKKESLCIAQDHMLCNKTAATSSCSFKLATV